MLQKKNKFSITQCREIIMGYISNSVSNNESKENISWFLNDKYKNNKMYFLAKIYYIPPKEGTHKISSN